MKEFIINLLNTLGLGVNGNIDNINLFRTKRMFPYSTFKVVEHGERKSVVNVIDDVTGSTFTLLYDHTEKGRITKVSISTK
jgi:hypothetical protein